MATGRSHVLRDAKKSTLAWIFNPAGLIAPAFFVLALVAAMPFPIAAQQPAQPPQTFEYRSYKDVDALFAKLGYTMERWRSGIREIPPVYGTNVPQRWRDRNSKEVSVTNKKRIFFRGLAPHVLRANEDIADERARVRTILGRLANGQDISLEDRDWLGNTAVKYKMAKTPDDQVDSDDYVEFIDRVDIVPPSLALAQAASESGWGTSRFADQGNSLFGMWTWGGKGITPEQQRTAEHGDHKVAAYDTVQESVDAYILNMNTHAAYRDLRIKRAELRRANMKVTGMALAETLIKYSERGQVYVDEIKKLMTSNNLGPADDAYLAKRPPIMLVAIGEGAK